MKKLLWEIFRITGVSTVLFFAGINLGFNSPHFSQLDESIWFQACFQFVTQDKSVSESQSGLNISDSNQTGSFLSKEEKPLSIIFKGGNFLLPPDSTDKITPDSLLSKTDSTFNLGDSLKTNLDTVKVDSMALDSTNRLKYFRYVREDVPYTQLKIKKQSSFFAKVNQRVRKVEIDSTGKFVTIKEEIAGKPSKILLTLPIEEYIKLRLDTREREMWESIGYEYQLTEGKKSLSDVIKDFTDFEIPLPSVGVLSIFGPPKISLKIGGSVQIHGAWRNETTEGVTASSLGNTRNEPDFKQQVQISVNGTIGDKLNISADWNTERTFEYENQLKIKYTGYEDEIIQSIEAGNVSLQTSPLVGGGEALFGIKAQFKMGPLSLTTIASQKKGEIKEVEVSGGSTATEFAIRPYEYSTNHYFLDSVYADPVLNIFNQYYGSATPIYTQDYYVKDIQVWKSINVPTIDRSKERFANAYIHLNPIDTSGSYPDNLREDLSNPIPGQEETGRFLLLTEGVDYILHRETGYITFNSTINEQDIIAVAYRYDGLSPSSGDDLFYGDFITTSAADTSQKIVLKLIKPKNLQPQFKTAWQLQLRNIYPLGARNIKEDGFEFNIKYELEGQDPVTDLPTPSGAVRLLNAFGLDILDKSKQPTPGNIGDNVFDYLPSITILPTTGEIIFPVLQPFGRDLPASIPDSLNFQQIYDTTKTFAQQEKIKDKWVMTGKSTGDATSIYQLGFNIVENSVRVILDGRELTPNVDYSVDYNIGQLTIKNDAALVPGANLKVTYEQNDLFQLASKTLLGARGIFDFSQKTKLGFSILNLNQQTLSDKVRIGEEPLSNTIYGVDFSTSGDLPIITKLLDKIISTREMSTFTLAGEYAYINPDPNTKKSTISSDNGQSIAYIDDFEGAKRTIPIGVGYTGWKDLSAPDSLSNLLGFSRADKMTHKGKSFWFTVTPSDVNVKDIFGDRKQVATSDQQVTVMDYVFMPDTPGTYNYNPDLSTPTKSWGGMQRILSSTANNLVEENVEFIEFWMNIQNAPPDAKLYIDLGLISEDVIPNNTLNTENINDVFINYQDEDRGLDGLFDDAERTTYGSDKSDPAGDNFVFNNSGTKTLFDYFNINGTQGNAQLTDIGRIPDTEDLNKNGSVDLANSYFRYEVPLDTSAARNPFIQGGGLTEAGWYLFRVPLKDTSLIVGSPSLSNVETIRMFVTGVNDMVHFRLAEFNLVGSQWQKVIPEDTVLAISTISFEDNPNYTIPPGISRERDRTRPDENILANEQSLNLILTNLEDGQKREGVKYLFKPLDVFNYSEMKLFIHGDMNTAPGSVSSTDSLNYSSEVYFRFGGDTNNYYEYRQPVRPDWNEISIKFSQLTAIKQARGDSINFIYSVPVDGKIGHLYSVKGNPSLTSVKFLTVGIFNTNNPNNTGNVSGEVWVNELRVIGADDSPGWAYSFNTGIKFADLLSVNANISQTNPYFHKLADRFGSRVEQKNWGVATELNILKLLPISLPESNLKLNYSHNESLGKPLFIPGTDVRVDEAAKRLQESQGDTTLLTTKKPEDLISETQTLSISDSWSLSNIKIKFPTKAWYIRDSFNALTFGFNFNKSFSRSPTVLSSKNWIWNASMNYGITFSSDYFFQPANIPFIGSIVSLLTDYKGVKVYYTPQSFTASLTAKRNRSVNVTRPQGTAVTDPIVSRDFTATRGFQFNWKLTEAGILNLSTSYNVTINSSLAFLETDLLGNDRSEKDIWKDIFGKTGFGNDYSYTQSFDLKSTPKMPSLWDINKYFTISSATYNATYRWNNDFRQVDLGRSAGNSSRTSVGVTLRWKALTEPLFQESIEEQQTILMQQEQIKNQTKTQTQQGNKRGRNRNLEEAIMRSLENEGKTLELDSTEIDLEDSELELDEEFADIDSTTIGLPKKSSLTNALLFLRSVAKFLLFDYETFTMNFSSDNSLSKSGIKSAGSGFGNFWGFSYKYDRGPARLFMLGLSDDVGPRAPNGNLSDVFSQKNNFTFKTSRPLWEGAKIDLNWQVGWSLNKNTSLSTDDFGNASINNITSTGSISRSFLSFPPVLVFSVFKSGIKKVAENYNPQSSNQSEDLSVAFLKGMESLPIFSNLGFLKEVAKYVPRPNWSLTWDGLEKLSVFKNFATKVSLTHAYTSGYSEGWKINPDGIQEIQSQKIDYGFSPLVGLNFTFGQLWGGNLTSSIKFSTKAIYDLGVTTRNITETFTKDIGITAGYTKSGFELPLFGVALKNDIEFSFSYTSAVNSTVRYEMDNFSEEGIPQDGTTRITIEPRIKYTISSKVTLSIFYKRSTVEPEGAARIPPTTTNEAGLDVTISIQ